MDNLISACLSGLDLLTVWLQLCGYSQRETAEMLSTSESVISRRLKRIRSTMQEKAL